MTITVRDFYESVVSNLAPIFQGQPRLTCLLLAVAQENQEIEEMFHQLIDLYNLETDNLVIMKRLAAIVGQPVTTSDVDFLRILVRTRILINRSSGLRDDLIKVLDAALVTAERPTWVSHGAAVDIYLTSYGAFETDPEFVDLIGSLLQEAAASGVYLRLIRQLEGGSSGFTPGAPCYGFSYPVVVFDPERGAT